MEIKKNAVGFAHKYNGFDAWVKASLSISKKRELVKILGKRASEFLDIEDFHYRMYIAREDCDIPEGAIGAYTSKDPGDFKVVKRNKFSKIEKREVE